MHGAHVGCMCELDKRMPPTDRHAGTWQHLHSAQQQCPLPPAFNSDLPADTCTGNLVISIRNFGNNFCLKQCMMLMMIGCMCWVSPAQLLCSSMDRNEGPRGPRRLCVFLQSVSLPGC